MGAGFVYFQAQWRVIVNLLPAIPWLSRFRTITYRESLDQSLVGFGLAIKQQGGGIRPESGLRRFHPDMSHGFEFCDLVKRAALQGNDPVLLVSMGAAMIKPGSAIGAEMAIGCVSAVGLARPCPGFAGYFKGIGVYQK